MAARAELQCLKVGEALQRCEPVWSNAPCKRVGALICRAQRYSSDRQCSSVITGEGVKEPFAELLLQAKKVYNQLHQIGRKLLQLISRLVSLLIRQ